jgi:hypothetical protein
MTFMGQNTKHENIIDVSSYINNMVRNHGSRRIHGNHCRALVLFTTEIAIDFNDRSNENNKLRYEVLTAVKMPMLVLYLHLNVGLGECSLRL